MTDGSFESSRFGGNTPTATLPLPNDEPVENTNHNDDADSALNNDEGSTNNCESSTTNNQTDVNKEEDPTMMDELMGAPYASPLPPFSFWIETACIAVQSIVLSFFSLGYLNVVYEVP
eukprot:scaffold1712_cov84-Cyclotella_meneghiniana.AAC.4